MRIIRCMSCEVAGRRVGYLKDFYGVLNAYSERVFRSTEPVYQSARFPNLYYCGNCLIHAQAVLTELVGCESINQVLNSDLKNGFKELATPNPSIPSRVFWHTTYIEMVSGLANRDE